MLWQLLTVAFRFGFGFRAHTGVRVGGRVEAYAIGDDYLSERESSIFRPIFFFEATHIRYPVHHPARTLPVLSLKRTRLTSVEQINDRPHVLRCLRAGAAISRAHHLVLVAGSAVILVIDAMQDRNRRHWVTKFWRCCVVMSDVLFRSKHRQVICVSISLSLSPTPLSLSDPSRTSFVFLSTLLFTR